MRTILKWLLRGIQLALLAALAAMQYYGTHTMGVHRHLVYRGQFYAAGLLAPAHLTAAAILILILLAVFPLSSYRLSGRKPESLRAFSFLSAELTLAVLFVLLALPVCRTLLLYPYLLLCATLVCLIQFLKISLFKHKNPAFGRGCEEKKKEE